MTTFEIASLVTSYVQIAVVWYGISRMVRANDQRAQAGERQARSQSDLVQRQERQAERRHTENMTALKALIERTGNGPGA